jgi:hypothetical protein
MEGQPVSTKQVVDWLNQTVAALNRIGPGYPAASLFETWLFADASRQSVSCAPFSTFVPPATSWMLTSHDTPIEYRIDRALDTGKWYVSWQC